MKKILVPTDFSMNAMKAITYAIEIAKRSGATIHLLHIIEPVIDHIHQPSILHDRLQNEIIAGREHDLSLLKDNLVATHPDVTIATALESGVVITAILDFARKLHPDLIVMGTKGANGLKEALWGSVTGRMIGKTTIPVLAIPMEYVMQKPDAIVFATNHFEKNTKQISHFIELAGLFNAVIHVVVYIDADTSSAIDYVYNQKELASYLSFIKNKYPQITFTGEILEGRKLAMTLEDYDRKNGVDMIVMVTYPKSFWERLMKKSVTKEMAFHSKIPILAIPEMT